VLVNPHSPDYLAHAIRIALDMPLAERKRRWEAMIVTVREDNVQRWTEDFTGDLAELKVDA
jgi:trehalose 6-phosphate synthase